MTGISQMTAGPGICSNPFTLASKGSSCVLSLQIQGSQMTHSITDGPIVCAKGSTLQCYKPSPLNVLNIKLGLSEYSIADNVSGLTGTVLLQNNGSNTETVSSNGTGRVIDANVSNASIGGFTGEYWSSTEWSADATL